MKNPYRTGSKPLMVNGEQRLDLVETSYRWTHVSEALAANLMGRIEHQPSLMCYSGRQISIWESGS